MMPMRLTVHSEKAEENPFAALSIAHDQENAQEHLTILRWPHFAPKFGITSAYDM